MTTHITAEENGGTVPVACALTPADLTAQRDHWQQLADRAMTGHVKTAGGVRLAFRPEPGVERELHALVAVENECCAWATWSVQANARRVVLDVRSTGAGIAVLHSMLADLRPAARQRPGA
jgi:hypothetical protein